LATQKRENNREHDRVSERSWDAGFPGAEDATRPWGEGEEETWAERDEERSGHEEVGLCENETHSLRNEAVDEEEDEGVEKDGHLAGLAVHNLWHLHLALGGQKNTWTECEKKGGWDGNFVGRKLGKHLIYTHIIFRVVCKVVETCAP